VNLIEELTKIIDAYKLQVDIYVVILLLVDYNKLFVELYYSPVNSEIIISPEVRPMQPIEFHRRKGGPNV